MKRLLLVSIAALVIPTWVQGRSIPSYFNSQTEISISSIRQRYAAINKSARKYRKVKKELSGFSLEGGELIAYFHGPRIVKITAAYFGESGRATEEYYYSDEKLIFVFRRDYTYDEPMTGKVIRTQANRFYFENDRLIRWIDENGRAILSSDGRYQAKQQELLDASNKFLKAARSPERTIEAHNTNGPEGFMQNMDSYTGSKLDDEPNYRQARYN